MNKTPDKNNVWSSLILPALSGTKRFFKSLSWEVFINYLASIIEKLAQIIKDNLPAIFSAIGTLVVSLYIIVVRFTGRTFIITGGQLLSIFGLVFLLALAVIYAPKIRKMQIARREEFVKVLDLDWKKRGNQLIGPYCPHCSNEVITENMLIETIGQALDGMFGEQSSYIYECTRCGQTITLVDGSLEQMKKEAHKRVFETQ